MARRPNRRRAAAALALFAAFLHSIAWPMFAAASASDASGTQLVEICTSDGVRLVPLPSELGGAPADPSAPATHQDCGACVCTGGACSAAACALPTEAVRYHVSASISLASTVGRYSAPRYALSHSRGPPA